jgi:group I intron endonuclease
MWYNLNCHAEQNTRALCFIEAAQLSQLNIVGKVPSIIGFRPVLAVPRDNGSTIYGGHFAMEENRPIYLYLYQNRENGKAYIGITINPGQRFKKHAKGDSGSLSFNHAIKKHGIENFEFKILAIFDDVNAADYHENAAIAAFRSLSPSGYNLIGGAPRSKYSGPMSQETKEKIGAANKKNILSKDHLEKMLEARRGKPGPNSGKIFSPEYRAKLSEAHKGILLAPSQREKMIAGIKKSWANKTPEQIEEHSRKVKEQWANMTQEQRMQHSKKVSERLTGKVVSSITRAKYSENSKKMWADPEFRERYSKACKGKHRTSPTSETREKISQSNKIFWANPNIRSKHSQINKEAWARRKAKVKNV